MGDWAFDNMIGVVCSWSSVCLGTPPDSWLLSTFLHVGHATQGLIFMRIRHVGQWSVKSIVMAYLECFSSSRMGLHVPYNVCEWISDSCLCQHVQQINNIEYP